MSSKSPLDDTYYYRFFNNVDQNNTMSSGASRPKYINMTAQGSLSSENWQLFPQSGRYFLRNYDYGGEWQLGLTTQSLIIPSMLPRSGDLGQQWILNQWSDGTWSLKNELAGNDSFLSLTYAATVPAMDTNSDGSHWNIEINVSAGQITNSDMLSSVGNLQVGDLSVETS